VNVRDSIAGQLCAEVFVAVPLAILFGLGMVTYHYRHRASAFTEASAKNYVQFFESIVEPVPGAPVDTCEGQSPTPAVVRRLRRSPTLAELEHLFGPSTIERQNASRPSNTNPDATVEVRNWAGGLKAEFYTTRGKISDVIAIEFKNERVGQSPDAWRKYCDAPELDLDVVAQVF
jgi:hypothetical protein